MPPIVGVLDFDECPAFYAPIVAPVPVRCFSLEKTTRHAVRPLRDEPLPPQIADVVVALVWHTIVVSAELIRGMPRLRLVVRIGAGYDNVDREECARKGIALCNVPDYGTGEVADSALSHILNLLRRTAWQANRVRDGVWEPRADGAQRVQGKVLGILGLGRIGKATALRAKAFGMGVLFYDPYRPDGEDKALGITRVDGLEGLLRQVDVLSIHCDLNAGTRHMINADTLRMLKRGAYVVNTARGGIVEIQALVAALRDGHLAGAGIDVLEVEPAGPDLSRVPNLELTPHTAFYSAQSWEEMKLKAAMEAQRLLTGEAPRNVIAYPSKL